MGSEMSERSGIAASETVDIAWAGQRFTSAGGGREWTVAGVGRPPPLQQMLTACRGSSRRSITADGQLRVRPSRRAASLPMTIAAVQ